MLAFPQQEDSEQDSTSEVPRYFLRIVIVLELLEELLSYTKMWKGLGVFVIVLYGGKKGQVHESG